MADTVNPVARSIDGATGDWSMSGDAMRWSPELAERGTSTGEADAAGAGNGLAGGVGLDVDGLRRLVSGALTSLGTVVTEVASEFRQLTRGSSPED